MVQILQYRPAKRFRYWSHWSPRPGGEYPPPGPSLVASPAGVLSAICAAALDSSRREVVVVKLTIFHVKLVHTLIFWVLSTCVLFSLYGGVADQITPWTWAAVGLVLVESVVLAASGWTCPLTILAERLGAVRGSVSDIFLPKWLADRIFPICGTTYGVALVAILFRVFR